MEDDTMHGLRIYYKEIRINFLAGFQYKGWPLMTVMLIIYVMADPLSVILLSSRFGNLGTWSLERILLVYAIAVSSYGLAQSFLRGFDYFPTRMIRSGDFDRILLRPVNIACQVAGAFFHIHRLSRLMTGLGLIVWSLFRLQIVISVVDVCMLCCGILGGFVLYSGMFILIAGISFYTIRGLDWVRSLWAVGCEIARIPTTFMPHVLKGFFTFIIPILVISYYPAAVVCDWGEPVWIGWMALPAGLSFFAIAYGVWRMGMRRYQSTGS